MITEHTVVLQTTIEKIELAFLLDKGYTLDEIVLYLQGQIPSAIHAYMKSWSSKVGAQNPEKPVITIQRSGEKIVVIQPKVFDGYFPIMTLLFNLAHLR